MANRRQEFYMSVKAILDQSQVKKDAKELQDLLDNTKIDFDSADFEHKVREIVNKMSKETLAVIGHSFNDAFKILGKNPLKIDEIIEKPNADMWEEMGKAAGELFGRGLQSAVSASLRRMNDSMPNKFMKEIDAISQAASRLVKKNGNIKTGKVHNITSGFKYKAPKNEESLNASMEHVQYEYSSAEHWEDQYVAMLKYKKIYDSFVSNGLEIPDKFKKLGKYTYEQINEAFPRIQASLQNIFNFASVDENGMRRALIGLTEGGAVDVSVVPSVIKTVEVYDLLDGKSKIEIPVEAVVGDSDKDKLKKSLENLAGVKKEYHKFYSGDGLTGQDTKKANEIFESQARPIIDEISEITGVSKEDVERHVTNYLKNILPDSSTLKKRINEEVAKVTRVGQEQGRGAGKTAEEIEAENAALREQAELLDKISEKRGNASGADEHNNNGPTQAELDAEKQRREEAERRLAEEESRRNARRDELISELDGYDESEYYDTENLEEILARNREILDLLSKENLITEDLRVKYDAINHSIEERIANQIAYRNAEEAAEKSFDELDELHDKISGTDDPDEVNGLLEERKRILSEISTLVRDDYEETIDGEIRTNELIEKRISLLREAKSGIIDIDDVDDIMSESGDLDSKLERLGDVADQWGAKIKDDETDEVTEELEEFEATYDRIILKLANGRKIEILPNAKGLRALYKYADGISSDSYGESEIEDVIFERVKKEQGDVQETIAGNQKLAITYDELKEKVEAYYKVKNEAVSLHNAGHDISHLVPSLRAMEEDIVKYFDKNNSDPTQTPDGYAMMLQASDADMKSVLSSMCHTLGIEIPQTAQNAEGALDNLNDELKETASAQADDDISSVQATPEPDNKVPSDTSHHGAGASINEEDLQKVINYINTTGGDAGDVAKSPWATEATLSQVTNKTLDNILSAIKTGGSANGGNANVIRTPQVVVKEQTTFSDDLSKKYQKIGKLRAEVENTPRGELFDELNAQLKQLEAEVKDKVEKLHLYTTEIAEYEAKATEAYNKRKTALSNKDSRKYDTDRKKATADTFKEEERVNAIAKEEAEKEAAEIDREIEQYNKDRTDALDALAEKYEELGVLRAKFDETPSGEYSDRLKQQIAYKEESIKKEKEFLNLSRQEISLLENKSLEKYNDHRSNYDDKTAQEIDKARKKSTADRLKENDKAKAKAFGEVVALSKEYNKWMVKAANASDDGLKSFYSAEATRALEERNDILKQYKKTFDGVALTEEQIAELKALNIEREEKLAEISAKQAAKDFNKKVKEAQKDVTMKSTGSSLRKSESSLFNIMSDSQFSAFDSSFKEQVKEYEYIVSKFKNTYTAAMSEIAQNGFLSDDTEKNLIDQMNLTDEYAKKIDRIVKEHNKLQGNNIVEIGKSGLSDSSSLAEYEKKLTDVVGTYETGKVHVLGFDAETRRLKYEVEGAKNTFVQYEAAVDGVTGSFVRIQGKTRSVETVFDKLKRKTKEIATYFAGSLSIYTFVNEIKKGIQYVKEIDSALTELKKVTDETDESYERFLSTAAKTGSKIGSTISEFTQATAEFARLGYNMDLASQMAEAALVYTNVGDGIDASGASQSIISAMKGFGMAASESMAIVDKFNEVGNRFAITSTGIGDALQRSASALYAAGNTIDESIALITAANSVVQDPTTVGTALKTLSLRVRGAKVELEAAGEDIEGMANSTSELQRKLLALTGGEVDIMLDENTFKSTTQILREMSKVWDQMSDVNQAAALELLGGKRQANTLSAIISDFETVEEVIEASENSAGSALKENEKYLDSIQGKIDQFNNTLQSVWSDLLDSDLIKGLIDLGTKFLQVVDDMGAFRLALSGLLVFLNAKYFKIDFLHPIEGIKKAFGKETIASIDAMRTKLTELEETYKNAKKAYMDDPTPENNQKKKEAEDNYTSYRDETSEAFRLDDELKDARKNLAAAEDALEGYTGTSEEELKKFQDEVDKSKIKVKELESAQIRNVNTGASGWKKLGKSVKKFGKQIASILTQMLVMWAISKVIEVASEWADSWVETAEEAAEAFDELNNELKDTKNEIADLTSQLEEVNDQIDDLYSRGKLSFTDQEELARLKEERAELERQIELKEQLAKQQQQGVNAGAIEQAEHYKNTGTKTGKTAGENIGTGALIGGGVGLAATAAGGAKLGALIGTAIAPGIGSAAGAVLGVVVGTLVGVALGSSIGGIVSATEETVGDRMENMQDQYSELQKKYEDARDAYHKDASDKNKEKFEKAQEDLTDYQSEMAKYFNEMDAYYSSIDLTAETDLAKVEQLRSEMNAFYDERDKWLITSGSANAESNAIARIFSSKEASEELKLLDEKFKELAANGEDAGFFDKLNTEIPEEVKERLDNLGISLTDLKYYYLDWAKSETVVEGSVYDTVKAINSLKDGVSNLKGAFDEFAETGIVTADTLVDLNDTFGTLGETWEDYVAVMSSGTATTQEAREATEELLEAFLNRRLAQGPIKDIEEYITLIGQLQNLGVTNAKTYVDSLQKTSMINSIGSAVVNDKNEGNKSQSQLINEYTEKYQNEYGIVLSAEERLLIEKAITVEKAKQAAIDAATEEAKYQEAKRNKEEAKERFDKGEITKAEYDAIPVAVEPVLDAKQAQQNYEDLYNELQSEYNKLNLEVNIDLNNLEHVSGEIDKIQNAYSTLKDSVKEYNENGFLTLDNLQALLALEPEYLACLQMENGQLTINKQAMQNLVQAKLAEAKATVVQSTIAQLNELAQKAEADAINESATAANNAIDDLGNYSGALNDVAKDAIIAAGSVAEFNAAVQGATDAGVDQTAIDNVIANMQTRLKMIDDVGTHLSTNFNTIMGTGGGKSALDRIREKYEGKISNLENQQTYIQNEIDKIETEGETVSKSYYDELIDKEEDKIALYQQERNELLALYNANPTKETASAIWEVEHAIQESTMRMVEFRQSITDLYATAFDKLIEAYDNADDLLSDQQNYIEKYQELMELQGRVKTAGGIQEQISLEQEKMADNVSELSYLRQALANGVASGAIEVGSKEWVDMQDKIRAAEEAVLDNKIAIEQYRDELEQLATDAFDIARNAFSNKDNFLTNQQDYIQGYIDLLKSQSIDVPDAVYQKLIDIEADRRANFVSDLADAQVGLATIGNTMWSNAMASSPEMANWTDEQKQAWLFSQEQYVEAYNSLTETEGKIQDCDVATAEWQKTIRDMDFAKFDRFISRLDDIDSEIDNIRGLFDDDDVAFSDGTWTDEGITSLGLIYQQMELAQQKSQEYAGKIDELNESYEDGEISENEYYERLQELKDGQWDAINAYEDAKDAIVDMEEARIDMIEEGLNEEIEAYEELIQLKQDELSAERDLYDFKKKVKDQTKSIAELERRIASLSGSSADADVAERRKLEAELRDAKENLNDTYYQRSKDSQSKALDDELESFQRIREEYVEELRETLEDTATVIAEKMTEVLANADTVHNKIQDTAEEYGIPISNALIAPWEAGVSASDNFKQVVETSVGNIKTTVENSTSELTSNLSYPWSATSAEGGAVNTFSTTATNAINGAVNLAKDKADDMFDQLSKPWKDMTAEDGPLDTFSESVSGVYDQLIQDAKQYVIDVNAEYDKIEYPSYTGSGDTGGNGDNGGTNALLYKESYLVGNLQRFLNRYWNTFIHQATGSSQLSVDNKYGPKTQATVKAIQKFLGITQSGQYDAATIRAMQAHYDKQIKAMKNYPSSVKDLSSRKSAIPAAVFAKGTLGTKQDELAITDESWIGEEITLAAGKNGQLQYLKKGSAVMPSDISANLVEWGKLNPNMIGMTNTLSGMNFMSNYISKPELNLSFEALVKAQNITEETLPAVKKLVTEELDKFARKLNYAIKRA